MCTKCLRVSPARMEFSPSFFISGQNVKWRKFCFDPERNIWRRAGGKERGAEGESARKTKACVRGDLSVVRFMDSSSFFFFFLESANHARHAERDDCCAPSAELDFKVNLYLSHGRNIKKKKGLLWRNRHCVLACASTAPCVSVCMCAHVHAWALSYSQGWCLLFPKRLDFRNVALQRTWWKGFVVMRLK